MSTSSSKVISDRLLVASERRGSILIMVIALLVMLALIGTAFLSSSRSDRAAAQQSTNNSQLDLVAQGVSDLAANSIVNALYDQSMSPSSYRNPMAIVPTAPIALGTSAYHNFTSPEADWYLASRIPRLDTTNYSSFNPFWDWITAPLAGSTFEDPTQNSPITGAPLQWGSLNIRTKNTTQIGLANRNQVGITSSNVGGTVYPALIAGSAWDATINYQIGDIVSVSSGAPPTVQNYISTKANNISQSPPASANAWTLLKPIVGADADGDGIADSGLFKIGTIPGSQFSGITFYAGIRIVDNNSAINASTAWTYNNDATALTDLNTAQPGLNAANGGTGNARNNRLNPMSVGLREMMTDAVAKGQFDWTTNTANVATLYPLVNFRLNNPPILTGLPRWTYNSYTPAVWGDFDPGAPATLKPTYRVPPASTDYQFISELDGFWAQFGSRYQFPGFTGNGTDRYQSLTDADTAALAHRFILLDSVTNPSLSYSTAPSQLERSLPTYLYNSTYNSTIFKNTPFAASDYANWFNYNFNYPLTSSIPTPPFSYTQSTPTSLYTVATVATPANLRPLLVAHNPVSNLAPRRMLLPAALPDYTVRSADYVAWNTTKLYNTNDTIVGTDGRVYRAIQAVPANTPPPNLTYWKSLHTLMTSVTTGGVTVVTNGLYNAGVTYQAGDVVLYQANATDNYNFYVALQAVTAVAPITPPSTYNSTQWQYLPWSTAPGKVNVNKAPFADLWQAYWNVMVGNVTANAGAPGTPNILTPFQATVGQNANSTADTNTGIFEGNHFSNTYPFGPTAGDFHYQRMFRSSVRDSSAMTVTPEDQQILLRSAIAAVNTEQLRQRSLMIRPSGVEQIITRAIPFHVKGLVAPDTAVVYGQGIQPFITEIYYNNNKADDGSGANPNGYMAIVLYNPYEVDISLDNMVLATEGSFGPPKTLTPFRTFAAGSTDEFGKAAIIPTKGYAVLENYPGDAVHRPSSAQLASVADNPTTKFISVPNLASSLDGQPLVILRPHQGTVNATGTQITYVNSTGAVPILGTANTYTWNDATADQMVPVDAFNFQATANYPYVDETGDASAGTYVAPTAYIFHYVRENDTWKFVYPGRYDGANSPYQEGFIVSDPWHPQTKNSPSGTAADVDPWASHALIGPAVNLFPTPSTPNKASSYPGDTFTIQLNNQGFGGPDAISTVLPNHYPLGGFMREGDILQVPFIGSYKILTNATPANYTELSPVTIDSAFAEDTDPNDNFEENIGRFCPIMTPVNIQATNATNEIVDSLQSPLEYNYNSSNVNPYPNPTKLRYGWAGRLFDFLTVRDPVDQSLPDAEAGIYKSYSGAPTPQPVPTTPSAVTENGSVTGQPITPQTHPEVGVDGLININTAPYPVLAAIPWTIGDGLASDLSDNAAIAQEIVSWRAKYGPIHNLFELNQIFDTTTGAAAAKSVRTRYADWGADRYPPVVWPTGRYGNWTGDPTMPTAPTAATFANANSISLGATYKDNAHGDFSPVSTTFPAGNAATPDGVAGDFESQYLMMTRLSNMLTTRSDTFTVYIVIEGWENVGTTSAKRVVQHRVAFIVDRTNITPTNRTPKITMVPAN